MNSLQIGKILINKNFVSKSQLKKALDEQKSCHLKLGDLFVQKGLITRSQLRQVLLEKQLHDLMGWVVFTFNTVECSFFSPLLALPSQYQPRGLYHLLAVSSLSIGRLGYSKPPGPMKRSLLSRLAKPEHRLQAQSQPAPTVASPLDGFCHPLNGKGSLSQGIRSGTHQGRMEYAYDLASPIGTPVYAMRAGRVTGVRDKYPDTGGGQENASRFNYVQIEHANGYRSTYAHLQQGFRRRVSIKAGDWVKTGELIGYTGNSGWSAAPHLHIEVQRAESGSKFSKTVPFRISGTCSALAQEPA